MPKREPDQSALSGVSPIFGQVTVELKDLSVNHISVSALLYEPPDNEIFHYIKDANTSGLYRWGSKSDQTRIPVPRMIFSNVALSKLEEDHICQFGLWLYDSISKERRIYDWLEKRRWRLDGWIGNEILRLLQAAEYNYLKTFELLVAFVDFREKLSRKPLVSTEIKDLIERTGVYWHGRDYKYRPILIIRAVMCANEGIDSFELCLTFCLEFFLRYLCIPGRVENWTIIVDLQNCGITQLPVQSILRLLEIMNSRYRGRLGKLFTVRIGRLVSYIVKPIALAFPVRIADKISLLNADFENELLKTIPPDQLEEEYGGIRPTIPDREFYPFHFFPDKGENSDLIRDYINPGHLCGENSNYNDHKVKVGGCQNNAKEENDFRMPVTTTIPPIFTSGATIFYPLKPVEKSLKFISPWMQYWLDNIEYLHMTSFTARYIGKMLNCNATPNNAIKHIFSIPYTEQLEDDDEDTMELVSGYPRKEEFFSNLPKIDNKSK